jgi:putative FmdB family regulatory protein
MPTYEYACLSCGTHVEVFQRFSEDALTECGVCGGPLRKVFHPAGILFKGSGFYSTDSRQRSRGKASGDGEKSETGSGEKTGARSGSGSKGESGSGSTGDGGGSGSKGESGSGSTSEAGSGSKGDGSAKKGSAPADRGAKEKSA